MMILNAEGQILGRVSAYAAKKALSGEDVIVVNAEKAVISGRKNEVFDRYFRKLDIKNKGNYTKGPFHQKRPDRLVRKTIRGMLPYNKPKGREAYKRVMVYIGVPEDEIKAKHSIDVSKSKMEDAGAKKNLAGVTIAELCTFIGGRW